MSQRRKQSKKEFRVHITADNVNISNLGEYLDKIEEQRNLHPEMDLEVEIEDVYA